MEVVMSRLFVRSSVFLVVFFMIRDAQSARPPALAPKVVAGETRDRAWLLQPDVFARLSSGGKRLALFLNGQREPHSVRSPLPVTAVNAAPAAAAARSRGPLAAPAPRQNIRVNDPSVDLSGHTNSETSIAVQGSRIVVGFNDAGGDLVSGYGFSTDGGASFVHRRVPAPRSGFTLGDPVVAFGPAGDVYYSMLTVSDSLVSTVGVARSTDGGATFSAPTDVAVAIQNYQDAQDKPWLAVDAGATSPKKGNVYASWTVFVRGGYTAIAFVRSTDGGKTFSDPGALSAVDTAGVQGSVIAVAPNGDVYVAFEDGHLSPDGISLLKSTDGGFTFGGRRTVATFQPLGTLTGGGGVRANSFPAMAVDGKGVIHVAWAAASSGALVDRSDIFYARSTDAGATFSAPRKLNDDGTPTTQAFPSVAALADGSVAVRWADRRNDALNDGLTDVYMAISRDSGATFGRSVRVSDHSWVYGPIDGPESAGYHGDYDGLAADGTSFYLSWSDERGADPDVYFSVVPAAFDASTPDFNVSAERAHLAVKAGQSVSVDLVTSGTNGWTGGLALSATGPAATGLSYAIASPDLAAGSTTRLTLSASSAATPGDHLVTVSGTGGGLSRATSVWVTVYGAGSPADPPSNVTSSPGFTAGAGVKADPAGNLHLLYEDDSAAVLGEDVFYRRSTDGGPGFSAPLKLNESGSFGIDTALAVDASRVVAVWAGRRSSDAFDRVFVARSLNGGASFGAPVAVSPSSQLAQYPAVAIDRAGNVVVAYYDASSATPSVQTARSTDGGATFGSPAALAEGAATALGRPGLTFDSKGAAYLVYTRQVLSSAGFTSSARLAIARAGTTFSAPIDVSSASVANAYGPDVAVGPDDSVAIAFYNRLGTNDSPNREVVVVRSTDGGATFSTQAAVSSNAGQSFFPAVAVEAGGEIDVAWEDSTGNGQTDVFLSRSTDGGRTFLAPVNLSANRGLSGSQANPLESVGGSGRTALSLGAGGTVLVSWTDDSGGNPDVYLSVVKTAALTNSPPTAAITVSPGLSVEAGVPVAFVGSGSDAEGDALTFSWSFGDGTAAGGPTPGGHPFPSPGSYTVTLTVRDARGATGNAAVTVTVTAPTIAGTSLLLPVVLETAGLGGSRYSTLVTLVSRAPTRIEVLLSYTASSGGGSGVARVFLFPGQLLLLPGISYLRGRNLPIAFDDVPKIGTLLVTFDGVTAPSSFFAGARTYTTDPSGGPGAFGLFYTAAAVTTTSATLFGLQQTDAQRSNIAVVNAGADPITLRVTLRGPNGEDLGALPDQPLGGYGWAQFGQPLQGKAPSGRAEVTRVAGSSPFTAYAVLNDAVTSDGSFLPPVLGGDASGADRLVPIVLDVQGLGARFRTELTLANLGSAPLALTLSYRAANGFGGGSGNVPLTLAAVSSGSSPTRSRSFAPRCRSSPTGGTWAARCWSARPPARRPHAWRSAPGRSSRRLPRGRSGSSTPASRSTNRPRPRPTSTVSWKGKGPTNARTSPW